MGSKTVLFLSPRFPPHFANFVVALKRAGCNPVAIGDSPYHTISTALQQSLTTYYEVPSLEDYDAVYRAVAYLAHTHGKIAWVQSHNEHWLVLEAKIREDFNIKGGYLPSEIIEFRKKSVMKQVFKQNGLAVARGHVLDSYDKVMDFVHGKDGVGYPIVVKPDTGVGAVDTFRLASDADVKHFFDTCFKERPKPYIFEEFVQGKLYTFDGLTTKSGEIMYCGSFEYDKGVMDTVNDADGMYYYIHRDMPEDMLKAGRSLVKAFQVRGHFFHFEVFRTPQGVLVPLEVNLRLPGGNTIDMYNFAFDADFYQLWADIVAERADAVDEAKKRFEQAPIAAYYVCYQGRKFAKQYAVSHEDILSKCVKHSPRNGADDAGDVQMVMNMEIAPLFRQSMGDYAYVFRSTTEKPLLSMIKTIES